MTKQTLRGRAAEKISEIRNDPNRFGTNQELADAVIDSVLEALPGGMWASNDPIEAAEAIGFNACRAEVISALKKC